MGRLRGRRFPRRERGNRSSWPCGPQSDPWGRSGVSRRAPTEPPTRAGGLPHPGPHGSAASALLRGWEGVGLAARQDPRPLPRPRSLGRPGSESRFPTSGLCTRPLPLGRRSWGWCPRRPRGRLPGPPVAVPCCPGDTELNGFRAKATSAVGHIDMFPSETNMCFGLEAGDDPEARTGTAAFSPRHHSPREGAGPRAACHRPCVSGVR